MGNGETMKELSISAAIILISKDMKTLIIQRNPDDSFPNMWTVPGGKLKDSDYDFSKSKDFCYYPAENAAIREVIEETGITVKQDQLRFLCSLYLKEINRFILSFYAILDKDADSVLVNLSDNQNYAWSTNEEIKEYEFIPDIGGEIKAAYTAIEHSKKVQ